MKWASARGFIWQISPYVIQRPHYETRTYIKETDSLKVAGHIWWTVANILNSNHSHNFKIKKYTSERQWTSLEDLEMFLQCEMLHHIFRMQEKFADTFKIELNTITIRKAHQITDPSLFVITFPSLFYSHHCQSTRRKIHNGET